MNHRIHPQQTNENTPRSNWGSESAKGRPLFKAPHKMISGSVRGNRIAVNAVQQSSLNNVTRTNMKPNLPSHFKFTLSVAVLVLAASAGGLIPRSAYADPGDLFASVNGTGQNAGGSIYQYAPDGTQSTFVSGLGLPRGLVFDSAGNFFVATNTRDNSGYIQGTIFKITPDGLMSTFASGFPANFFLQGLVTDSDNDVFVAGQDQNFATTIYKITPGGTVSTFGFVPGDSRGLAFDSSGYLFAPDSSFQTIYTFTPDGIRGVFVPPPPLTVSVPTWVAFDSSDNLFGSIENPPYNTTTSLIVKFNPDGTGSEFATGLANPRSLAFDSAGNLFVADIPAPNIYATNTGQILKFTPGGTGTVQDIPPVPGYGVAVFASGIGPAVGSGGGPEYLAFQPPNTTIASNVTTAVALTFPNATAAGSSTVTSIDPSSVGTLPSEFELSASVGFEITTTVTYTPPIIIAFQVSAELYALGLGVLHSECSNSGESCTETCTEGCTLVPRAILPGDPGYPSNPAPNTIYASVSSLSPFVIAKLKFNAQIQQPINADGSSVFSVKRGVVPVKFTLTQDGAATCVLPAATIALTRTSGGTTGTVDESVYSGSADTGSNFRINSCQYVYNLNSGALGVGTYRVDIKINGTVVGNAIFQLK